MPATAMNRKINSPRLTLSCLDPASANLLQNQCAGPTESRIGANLLEKPIRLPSANGAFHTQPGVGSPGKTSMIKRPSAESASPCSPANRQLLALTPFTASSPVVPRCPPLSPVASRLKPRRARPNYLRLRRETTMIFAMKREKGFPWTMDPRLEPPAPKRQKTPKAV